MDLDAGPRYAVLAAVAGALYMSDLVEGWYSWAIISAFWMASGGYYTLYLAYHTLGRDLR
jgi:hypothetical protein